MIRILLLIFAVFFLNDNCSAQDTIVKMNGRKTICKVLEVTQVKVVYSDSGSTNQRVMDQIGISHIKYQDGTIDFFRSTSLEKVEQIDNKKNKNVFNSGMFLSVQPGYSYFHKFGGNKPDPVTLNLGGVSIKLENRFYFGKGDKFRNGIQTSWIEVEGYFNSNNLTLFFGLLNPGYCGAFLISKTSAIEYNLNFGAGMVSNYKSYLGIKITPKIEYTTKRQSFGMCYSTFLAGNEPSPLIKIYDSGYSTNTRAIFHNFNLSYRFKF